jgi:hypothetical protein
LISITELEIADPIVIKIYERVWAVDHDWDMGGGIDNLGLGWLS